MLWLIPIFIGLAFFILIVVYSFLSKGVPSSRGEEEERGLPDIPASILEKIRKNEPLTPEEVAAFERGYAKLRGQSAEYMRDAKTKDEIIANLKEEVKQRRASPAAPPAVGNIRGKKVLSVDGKVLGVALGWTFSEPEGYIGIAIRPNRAITNARVIGFNLRARDISGIVTHPESVSSSHVITVKLDSALKPSDLMTTSEVARLKEELVDKDRELTMRRAETSALNREIQRWRNGALAAFLAAPEGYSRSGGDGLSPFTRGFLSEGLSTSDIDAREAAMSAARQVVAERHRSKMLGDLYGNAQQELQFWRDLAKAQMPERLKRMFMSDPELVASSLTEYIKAFSGAYDALPQDAKDLLIQTIAGNIEKIQSAPVKEQVAKAAEALTGRPVPTSETAGGVGAPTEAASEGGVTGGGE